MATVEAYEFQRSASAFLVAVSQSKAVGKCGDTASTVAAHRAKSAVAVIVSHLKISTFGVSKRHQPIGTDTKPSVAQMRYLLLRKLRVSFADIHNDKIVARTVVFNKIQIHRI